MCVFQRHDYCAIQQAIITDKLKGHDSEHTILPVILNSEILRELCCSGVLSDVDGVAAASCEILGFLLSMREEVFWPELRDSLLQWLPYIEVSTRSEVAVYWSDKNLVVGKAGYETTVMYVLVPFIDIETIYSRCANRTVSTSSFMISWSRVRPSPVLSEYRAASDYYFPLTQSKSTRTAVVTE